MNRIRYAFATALLFVSTLIIQPVPALAQGAAVSFGGIQQDTSAPIDVTAESLSINQTDGTALYTGNVVVGQGEMRLSAPRVLVVFNEDGSQIQRMEATGGVTLVNGAEAAEAARADYELGTGVVTMTGDVLLTQGANALTAEKMVVELDTGTAQMTGRVRTVIKQQPDQN